MSFKKKPHRRRGSRQWSGPGPDARDPQAFGALMGKLVRDKGWRDQAAHAGLFARWGEIVGPEIAGHCRPVSCTDGELVVEAESATWATQLRLFNAQILARLRAELGPKVVTRVRIHGPSQPGYVAGGWRASMRKPRNDRHSAGGQADPYRK